MQSTQGELHRGCSKSLSRTAALALTCSSELMPGLPRCTLTRSDLQRRGMSHSYTRGLYRAKEWGRPSALKLETDASPSAYCKVHTQKASARLEATQRGTQQAWGNVQTQSGALTVSLWI